MVANMHYQGENNTSREEEQPEITQKQLTTVTVNQPDREITALNTHNLMIHKLQQEHNIMEKAEAEGKKLLETSKLLIKVKKGTSNC